MTTLPKYAQVYINTDRKMFPLPLQESMKSVSSHKIKKIKRNKKMLDIDTYTALNNNKNSPETKIQCPICAFQMPSYNIGAVHVLILLSNWAFQQDFITGFPIM